MEEAQLKALTTMTSELKLLQGLPAEMKALRDAMSDRKPAGSRATESAATTEMTAVAELRKGQRELEGSVATLLKSFALFESRVSKEQGRFQTEASSAS